MLESSTAVTTSIAIYPNTSDAWDVLSPFPSYTLGGGDVAFVISTSNTNNDGSLKLLPSRLIDVGKISNSINFLAKTNLNQSNEPISNGIGGMSKLKDFTFTMTRSYLGTNIMDRDDIINLYGRKIVLFISESDKIETLISSQIEFTGRIYSIDKKDENITFTIRGLLNTANPLVSGSEVIGADGTITTEALVFGDAGEMYTPISKNVDEFGKVTLQFSQSDDFIIKNLFIKGGSENEPVFLSVDTPYEIVDDEIIFDTDEFSDITLKKDMIVESNSRITVQSYYEIGIVLKGDLLALYTPTYLEKVTVFAMKDVYADIVSIDGSLVKAIERISYPNDIVYLRTETVEDEDVLFFACGWELISGYLRELLDGGVWNDSGEDVILAIRFFDHAIFEFICCKINFAETGKLNPLEKESDAFLSDELNPSGTNFDFDGYELKDRIQAWDNGGSKIFQHIPKNSLIIQIDDEKMLVNYTEKDSAAPRFETTINSPLWTYVWVVRGWDWTTIATHSIDAPINILVDIKESIVTTLTKKLPNITTVTPSQDFKFSSIRKWLDGKKDLNIENYAGTGLSTGEHDNSGFIGLDWKLPELPGDLYKIFIKGSAECGFDPSETFTTPELNYKNVFINLALNTITVDNKEISRRIFGYRNGVDKKDRYAIAMYKALPTGTAVAQGDYTFRVSQDGGFQSDNTPTVYSFLSHDRSYLGDIVDVDELAKTSMFIVFNTSQVKGKKTWFKMSLPSILVSVKVTLIDADVYAQIIPKSIFDNFTDEYTGVGSNCKIAWKYGNTPLDKGPEPTQLIISDDDTKGYGLTTAWLDSTFLATAAYPFSGFTAGSKIAGKLVRDLVEFGTVGKIYPDGGLKEIFTDSGSSYDFDRTVSYPNGLLNVGKTFLERTDDYIWVDQANNRILIVPKYNYVDGNPVTVIETLLNTYYDDVTLNTVSFTKAREQRLDWNCRLLIKEGVYLKKIINDLAKEHGLITYENNKGEQTIIALDPPNEDPATDIDDTLLKYKDIDESVADFSEDFTELDYIVTKMDTYYNFINNKFQGFIKSEDLSDQSAFIIAGQFTENDAKIKLQLKSIFEQATADKAAIIKMIYHQIPTRLVTLKCTLGASVIELGQWVTCSSTGVPDVSGKIYLILTTGKQIPYSDKKTYIEFVAFEFDFDDLVLRIQEVPEQSLIDDYDEQQITTDDIDEVPNI